MKKLISFLLIVCSLLSLHISVFAENETVQVLVNTSIRFTVNGDEFIPREDDGTRVYPLTYNDRTYIPARFIAERVGLSVSWYAQKQIVGFGPNGKIEIKDIEEIETNVSPSYYTNVLLNKNIIFKFSGDIFIPQEADGTRVYPLTYNDRTYIPARFIMERAGIEVTWDEATQTVGFNTVSKPNESEKVDDLLSSTEKIADGVFPSMASVREHIDKMKLDAFTDKSNGTMEPEEKMAFRETALKTMILAGFDFVIYNDYNNVIVSFPSYADVYAYYMKNAKGKSDAEILKHLEDVYVNYGTNAIELTTLVESPNFNEDVEVAFVSNAWYNHDNDPNQNKKYILKHIAFTDCTKLNPLRGIVIKNISSGALLLDGNDSGSIFTFKSKALDTSYFEMLRYYIENKLVYKQISNKSLNINHGRILIYYRNGEYAFKIK